jgi:hypothetical protein
MVVLFGTFADQDECAKVESGDKEWIQVLPKDLDKDEYKGKESILAIMSVPSTQTASNALIASWKAFLETMAHPAMINCISVDSYVGSLYNFMAGPNGMRAMPFFRRVCQIVVAASINEDNLVTTSDFASLMVVLAAVIRELLQRENRARFHDDVCKLLAEMRQAAQLITGEDLVDVSGHVGRHLEAAQAMVDRAQGSIVAGGDTAGNDHTDFLLSHYPRKVVTPGGRHDNDHTDITKIAIFPTREELLCDIQEFLPSCDPDYPHFLTNKIDRHIDTQFRLLRHDIFGELNDVLGCLLTEYSTKVGDFKGKKINAGNTRINPYYQAKVSQVLLDRRRGLVVNVSFSQPQQISQKSPVEKQKWWEESRRLNEGVLLSLVWKDSSIMHHLFFTVSARNADHKDDHSLTSDKHRASITLRPMEFDQATVGAILDVCQKNIRGTLLEYPHVLPATFVPVLQSLQNMQKGSQFPFANWILPDPIEQDNDDALMEIPLPCYARRPGFAFPLTSILLPEQSAMRLSPSASVADETLVANIEQKTGLDHGQSIGLIAALTREYALIQGPPGTGKTFLGVRVMQVLRDVQNIAKLGPIIVV